MIDRERREVIVSVRPEQVVALVNWNSYEFIEVPVLSPPLPTGFVVEGMCQNFERGHDRLSREPP